MKNLKKRYILLIIVILGIATYQVYIRLNIPHSINKVSANQYEYALNGFTFNAGERLTKAKVFGRWGDEKMGQLNAKDYTVFYNFHGGTWGILSIYDYCNDWQSDNEFCSQIDSIGNTLGMNSVKLYSVVVKII